MHSLGCTRCLLACSRSVLFGARRCFVVSPVSRSLARCRTDGSPDGSGPGALYFLYIAITRWRHSGHWIDSPLTPPLWQSCLLLHGRTNTSRLRRDRAKEGGGGGRPPAPGASARAEGKEGIRGRRRVRARASERASGLEKVGPRRGAVACCGLHSCTGFSPGQGKRGRGRAIYSKEQGEEEKRADGVAGDGRTHGATDGRTYFHNASYAVRACVCARQTRTTWPRRLRPWRGAPSVRIFSRSARQDFGRTAVTSRRFAGGNVGVV